MDSIGMDQEMHRSRQLVFTVLKHSIPAGDVRMSNALKFAVILIRILSLKKLIIRRKRCFAGGA